MSDRKDHIKVLYQMLKQMEWNNGIMPIQSRIDALKFAINSLGVDEAYQLEYEHIAYITLDELKEIREEITRFTSHYSLAKERGGTGQVEWSDYIIKESDVLAILDKKISELEKTE